ncbi:hypothetical protein BDL97_13G080800 [Sphagnum fallax]|nr:hypothetical protein BDL97_13G080800 [Sphagnum fallax]KAH8943923.1 hypothetical protein BDL97_13G080800 [Sphagnum fallax]
MISVGSHGSMSLLFLMKKVTKSAGNQDLGLDSLDTVELVMAFEEEFAVEIPNAEADKISSCLEVIG